MGVLVVQTVCMVSVSLLVRASAVVRIFWYLVQCVEDSDFSSFVYVSR